ncbi:MAG: four helix bundle protein [Prolixibacteraceae bacterium]|jgi:four helix bundle protein|nr:four helix bundle protein [Prolixibacteraceae bacterium]
MSKFIIKEKSFSFAIKMVRLYPVLSQSKKEFVLSKQLLRSGTSVGALVREAQNAESKADFEHKLGIAQKECDESLYWLELLVQTNYLAESEFVSYHTEASELLKMIKSAIITSKSKSKPPKNSPDAS